MRTKGLPVITALFRDGQKAISRHPILRRLGADPIAIKLAESYDLTLLAWRAPTA